MPEYVLETYGGSTTLTSRDADAARRSAAMTLGRNSIVRGTLVGPDGKKWTLEHNEIEDGMNGWRYTDGSGSEKRVFPKQSPRPGTLWAGGWQGLYDLGKGRYMNAFGSEQFEDEDFALVGAVYYAIYDDSGEEIDGGWYGYFEDTRWNEFLRFAGLRNPRLIVKESDPKYTRILDSIEDGSYAKRMESPKSKRRCSTKK